MTDALERKAMGNWIKRVTSVQGVSDGKPVSEPAAITTGR